MRILRRFNLLGDVDINSGGQGKADATESSALPDDEEDGDFEDTQTAPEPVLLSEDVPPALLELDNKKTELTSADFSGEKDQDLEHAQPGSKIASLAEAAGAGFLAFFQEGLKYLASFVKSAKFCFELGNSKLGTTVPRCEDVSNPTRRFLQFLANRNISFRVKTP